jgi:hypothetical protein
MVSGMTATLIFVPKGTFQAVLDETAKTCSHPQMDRTSRPRSAIRARRIGRIIIVM